MIRRRGRPLPSVAICLAGVLLAVVAVSGASPDPSLAAMQMAPGDVRSGDAPGLVGGPFEVLLLVILLGLGTAGVTVIASRLGRVDGTRA